MDKRDLRLRRQQVEEALGPLRRAAPPEPARGWARSLREAYGMTLDTLGRRLGVTRSQARKLEVASHEGSITLARLRDLAAALDCQLVVCLVPHVPPEQAVRDRALATARRRLRRVQQNMVMEEQAVEARRLEAMAHDLADQLVARADQAIWQDG